MSASGKGILGGERQFVCMVQGFVRDALVPSDDESRSLNPTVYVMYE